MLLRVLLLVAAAASDEAIRHRTLFNCKSSSPCAVAELTDENWTVNLDSRPHLVMFYTSWCGNCKVLAPKFAKAAKALLGTEFKLGAINIDTNPRTQSQLNVRSIPKVYFVPYAGGSPIEYQGERSTDAIVEFAEGLIAFKNKKLAEAAKGDDDDDSASRRRRRSAAARELR